jgi:hypothetical protein
MAKKKKVEEVLQVVSAPIKKTWTEKVRERMNPKDNK